LVLLSFPRLFPLCGSRRAFFRAVARFWCGFFSAWRIRRVASKRLFCDFFYTRPRTQRVSCRYSGLVRRPFLAGTSFCFLPLFLGSCAQHHAWRWPRLSVGTPPSVREELPIFCLPPFCRTSFIAQTRGLVGDPGNLPHFPLSQSTLFDLSVICRVSCGPLYTSIPLLCEV